MKTPVGGLHIDNAAWLAAALDSADDAIVSVTNDGTVVSWNPGAERLFGYTAGEMIGQRLTAIFPPDRLGEERELRDRLARGERIDRHDTIRRHRDGRDVEVSITLAPIRDAQGSVVGATRIAREVVPGWSQSQLGLPPGRFERILGHLSEAVIAVDRDGRVNYMNAAAEVLTGCRGPTAVGRPIDSVLWLLDEATRQRIESPLLAALIDVSKPTTGQRASLISVTGAETPVQVTAAAIDDHRGNVLGAVMVLHDMTELRRAGQTQNWLATIVDASDDAMVSKTLEGVVLTWNRGAERIFGYTAAEMVGRPITVIFPPDRLGEEVDFLARLSRGEHIGHFESIRVRRDGTQIDVSVTLSPVRDGSGRIVAVSKVARDISARKRAERDRAELRQREQAALQESVTLNRLKDEFIATLSHELRTPINAIMGWANLLKSGRLPEPDVARAVDVIARNAALQTQLIGDLMDLSAVVVGKMRLDIRPTDLARIVEAAIEAVRPSALAKGLELEMHHDGTTVEVMADAERLQQVVWNLLTNALKFTPSGGRIEVRLERQAAFARIVVIDTGVGIAADALPMIFDRFRQADGTTTRRHRGLGLGLAIARHLVDLHGGSIWADSEGVGRGARFTVELALLRGYAHPIPALAAQPPDGAAEGGELTGLHILVVDDDEASRQMVGHVLGMAGATVVEAASAAEALAAARRERFDVVVSDVAMPDTDGYVLMRALRRGRRLPLGIALTAFATDEDRERATSAGFHAHVAKPVLPQELVQEVSKLFGRTGVS